MAEAYAVAYKPAMIREHFGLFCASVALVLAASIWACATRYTAIPQHMLILDRWTGKVSGYDYQSCK